MRLLHPTTLKISSKILALFLGEWYTSNVWWACEDTIKSNLAVVVPPFYHDDEFVQCLAGQLAMALKQICVVICAVLNSEQKALLDFLVLAMGTRFVGFGSSTFSFYLVSNSLSELSLRKHRI